MSRRITATRTDRDYDVVAGVTYHYAEYGNLIHPRGHAIPVLALLFGTRKVLVPRRLFAAQTDDVPRHRLTTRKRLRRRS